MIRQKLRNGLFFLNPSHVCITESIICEGGHVGLLPAPAAYIAAVLHPVGIGKIVFREHQVFLLQNPVMVPLCIGYPYFLSRRSHNSQFTYPGGIHAEVIKIPSP